MSFFVTNTWQEINLVNIASVVIHTIKHSFNRYGAANDVSDPAPDVAAVMAVNQLDGYSPSYLISAVFWMPLSIQLRLSLSLIYQKNYSCSILLPFANIDSISVNSFWPT